MIMFGFRMTRDLKRWLVSEARRRDVTVQALAGSMLKQSRAAVIRRRRRNG